MAEDVLLAQGLGADSLDQIELVMGLEDTFGIRLNDEACAALGGWTVGRSRTTSPRTNSTRQRITSRPCAT